MSLIRLTLPGLRIMARVSSFWVCLLFLKELIWFKHIYFKSYIHGNYNIFIFMNIIGLEQKHYSLFGCSPSPL